MTKTSRSVPTTAIPLSSSPPKWALHNQNRDHRRHELHDVYVIRHNNTTKQPPVHDHDHTHFPAPTQHHRQKQQPSTGRATHSLPPPLPSKFSSNNYPKHHVDDVGNHNDMDGVGEDSYTFEESPSILEFPNPFPPVPTEHPNPNWAERRSSFVGLQEPPLQNSNMANGQPPVYSSPPTDTTEEPLSTSSTSRPHAASIRPLPPLTHRIVDPRIRGMLDIFPEIDPRLLRPPPHPPRHHPHPHHSSQLNTENKENNNPPHQYQQQHQQRINSVTVDLDKPTLNSSNLIRMERERIRNEAFDPVGALAEFMLVRKDEVERIKRDITRKSANVEKSAVQYHDLVPPPILSSTSIAAQTIPSQIPRRTIPRAKKKLNQEWVQSQDLKPRLEN
ncbi:hypothetical protein HK102_010924, partial [Quaeritorhiza haematococci]